MGYLVELRVGALHQLVVQVLLVVQGIKSLHMIVHHKAKIKPKMARSNSTLSIFCITMHLNSVVIVKPDPELFVSDPDENEEKKTDNRYR